MIIQQATLEDLDFIVEEGIKFLEYHPSRINQGHDINYLYSLAENLVENQVMLVAKDNGVNMGMISGVVVPAIFNPNYIVLQEVFWWVKEEFRQTMAGLKLLKAFEDKGKELKVSTISMVTTAYTPVLAKYYKKRGYMPVESTYIKEL